MTKLKKIDKHLEEQLPEEIQRLRRFYFQELTGDDDA